MNTITIARDPFARTSIERTSIPGREVFGGCDWCGQSPRVLFTYGTVPDSVYTFRHVATSPRWFCNLDCYRAFGG